MTAYTKRLAGSALVLAMCALPMCAGLAFGEAPAKQEPKPQVEVVFCLDTTGSMGGLIDAAKQKIWTIANQIASGKPTPRIKIGLVAYRDRGDQYITRIFDLTNDLDAVYGHLMEFRAEGGGDTPESVNQALYESVTKINWSTDKKTLKIIFLVGDAPPHMDYANDVPYPETCRRAVEKRIIINTVQCGNDAQTRDVWEKICRSAEGRYVQIDASGGSIVTVSTPYDTELAKINSELARSTLAYGRRRRESRAKAATALALPAPAAAERAAFKSKMGETSSDDLLDDIKAGKVQLESVSKDVLPEELKGLSKAQQRTFLKQLDQRRQTLMKQAGQLDQKRGAFITKKLAETQTNATRDSFDGQVLHILQAQAKRANIEYAPDEKK
jgi:Mg-chelatase subunit ChlD